MTDCDSQRELKQRKRDVCVIHVTGHFPQNSLLLSICRATTFTHKATESRMQRVLSSPIHFYHHHLSVLSKHTLLSQSLGYCPLNQTTIFLGSSITYMQSFLPQIKSPTCFVISQLKRRQPHSSWFPGPPNFQDPGKELDQSTVGPQNSIFCSCGIHRKTSKPSKHKTERSGHAQQGFKLQTRNQFSLQMACGDCLWKACYIFQIVLPKRKRRGGWTPLIRMECLETKQNKNPAEMPSALFSVALSVFRDKILGCQL